MRKKIYLAGPMRGYPSNNFPQFHQWAKWLRESGYEVVNPAELDLEAGVDPDDVDTKLSIRDAFRRDVIALLDCDAVAVLSGWTYSKGARAEVSLALAADMPVYRMDSSGRILWTITEVQ